MVIRAVRVCSVVPNAAPLCADLLFSVSRSIVGCRPVCHLSQWAVSQSSLQASTIDAAQE